MAWHKNFWLPSAVHLQCNNLLILNRSIMLTRSFMEFQYEFHTKNMIMSKNMMSFKNKGNQRHVKRCWSWNSKCACRHTCFFEQKVKSDTYRGTLRVPAGIPSNPYQHFDPDTLQQPLVPTFSSNLSRTQKKGRKPSKGGGGGQEERGREGCASCGI